MNKASPQYKMVVHVLSGAVNFLLTVGLFVTYRYTDVPYLLVFVGWFLRSAIIRSSKSEYEDHLPADMPSYDYDAWFADMSDKFECSWCKIAQESDASIKTIHLLEEFACRDSDTLLPICRDCASTVVAIESEHRVARGAA